MYRPQNPVLLRMLRLEFCYVVLTKKTVHSTWWTNVTAMSRLLPPFHTNTQKTTLYIVVKCCSNTVTSRLPPHKPTHCYRNVGFWWTAIVVLIPCPPPAKYSPLHGDKLEIFHTHFNACLNLSATIKNPKIIFQNFPQTSIFAPCPY